MKKEPLCGNKQTMRENPKAAGNSGGQRAGQQRPTQQARSRSARKSVRRQREGWLIPLCILVPPIGAAYMWAMQRYSMRTRLIVSVLAGIILFFESYLFFSDSAGMPDATTFMPGSGSVYAPASVTAEPTALPDATALPYEYVEADATPAVTDDGSTQTVDSSEFVPNTAAPAEATFVPADTVTESESQDTSSQDTNQDTIVYTADGALFYHASSSCGGKEYSNAMTLRDAQSAGLAACNNCNPP